MVVWFIKILIDLLIFSNICRRSMIILRVILKFIYYSYIFTSSQWIKYCFIGRKATHCIPSTCRAKSLSFLIYESSTIINLISEYFAKHIACSKHVLKIIDWSVTEYICKNSSTENVFREHFFLYNHLRPQKDFLLKVHFFMCISHWMCHNSVKPRTLLQVIWNSTIPVEELE